MIILVVLETSAVKDTMLNFLTFRIDIIIQLGPGSGFGLGGSKQTGPCNTLSAFKPAFQCITKAWFSMSISRPYSAEFLLQPIHKNAAGA